MLSDRTHLIIDPEAQLCPDKAANPRGRFSSRRGPSRQSLSQLDDLSLITLARKHKLKRFQGFRIKLKLKYFLILFNGYTFVIEILLEAENL